VTSRYKLVHFDRPDLDVWELFDRRKTHMSVRVVRRPGYATVVTELKRSSTAARGAEGQRTA
jgi:hypothetical protein